MLTILCNYPDIQSDIATCCVCHILYCRYKFNFGHYKVSKVLERLYFHTNISISKTWEYAEIWLFQYLFNGQENCWNLNHFCSEDGMKMA